MNNRLLKYSSLALLMAMPFASCKDDDDEKPVVIKANFTATPLEMVQPNCEVTLNADSIPGNNISYKWDFGDEIGLLWASNNEYCSSIKHSYKTYGEYTITLTVSNGTTSDMATQTIKINAAAPKSIMPSLKYEGSAPYQYVLQKGVLNADEVRFHIFKIEEKNSIPVTMITANAEEESGSYTFETPGLYHVNVVAYGPGVEGSVIMRTDTVEVFKDETPGVDKLMSQFEVNPIRLMQPSTEFSFYLVKVNGDNISYHWDFGDGVELVWKNNDEFLTTVNHKYETFGEYTVTLTVKDDQKSESSTNVVIIDAAPPKSTMKSQSYHAIAPYMHDLVSEVMYSTKVEWHIYKEIKEDDLEEIHTMEVPDGKDGSYLFNTPGKYLLYEYAYGPGVEGSCFMRADTVFVDASIK